MAQVLGNLVTAAGYSWEPGAESRTPSNTCSKCELNPELWSTTTRVLLGILVAPCDTSFKTFQSSSARDKRLSELQPPKVPAPSGRVTFLAPLPGKRNICRISLLVRYCLILKLNELYAEQGKPGVELNLRDWH
ncbi:hypothetical protein PIB30_040454 [Stylosanthes scabra]|uniref:Uncharacterized protein n=1 Tax=Stylosanthes scabra TaxID=79078 RepID=A0ABU6WEL7_9FABA|nr:hypothetical protein [Stylosanthes scabra]